MNRGVFLDRDGTVLTLSGGTGYLNDVRHMRLLPGVAGAIRRLNQAGFLVFIHTNQAIVGRGILSEKELQRIHAVLVERLRTYGAHIDGIYYCPHHPEALVRKYRAVCDCRKPSSGMLRQAMKEHNVGVRGSFLVGDSSKDILAGERAGLATILVRTGNAGNEPGAQAVHPDHVAKDLLAAVRWIEKTRASKARVKETRYRRGPTRG